MDDLLSEFLTETAEMLERLDVELVGLERNPNDPEPIANIFRLVHTIKGTCGFLGLPRLETVAHAAESVLGKLRDGALEVTPASVTLILEALDAIKSILAALEAIETEPAGDDSDLISRLGRAAAGELPGDAGPVAGLGDAAARAPSLAGRSVRVNVDLLETLMTTASELVLVRYQLGQMLRKNDDSELKATLLRLGSLTTGLQDGVLKARMQPIGSAWRKLPRIVRDLERELGKKIELRTRGGATELDRQVLELIRDPLIHMVRNAADHGLESLAERRAAGKRETGRIELSARHEGGHVIVEVADDGCGIDVAKIKAAAAADGLATAAQLEALTDAQVRQFIFEPGFSTADAVTSVSGRGVGLDVVRSNIEEIGGAIEMKSATGEGATFVIRIPLTLAVASALIVEAAGQRFAVPQIGVIELIRVTPDSDRRIERIDGTPVLRRRGRLLPLVSLAALLEIGDGIEDRLAAAEEACVVAIQAGAHRFGIVVDKVIDAEEIVVKPVAPLLRDIGIYAGNAVLGDGSVIMILDAAGIAAAAGEIEVVDMAPQPDEVAQRATDHRRVPMLLFRAGGGAPKAVPLALVARVEEFERARIEATSRQPVVRYRGQLMPLIPFDGAAIKAGRLRQPVLVFTDRDVAIGLMVDEIVGIFEEPLDIELTTHAGGIVGTAVIAGEATRVIDASWYLSRAHRDGPAPSGPGGGPARRVLLVDDNPFFRNLLTPLLSAAGYDVFSAESAAEALSLRDAGERFDAILSGIEMPGMDGFAFLSEVKQGGPWRATPIVALAARTAAGDAEKGRLAGFADYVGKDDRDRLLDVLAEAVGSAGGTP